METVVKFFIRVGFCQRTSRQRALPKLFDEPLPICWWESKGHTPGNKKEEQSGLGCTVLLPTNITYMDNVS